MGERDQEDRVMDTNRKKEHEQKVVSAPPPQSIKCLIYGRKYLVLYKVSHLISVTTL